jgi:hypothetical protein
MNDDLDLLASAYLDGDLDDAARAEADRDPAVAARVAELRTVRDAVATVGPATVPQPDTRARLLAAALAAYDELHATIDTSTDTDTDVAAAAVLVHAPPRRARSSRSRWLGAVAAATVVAAGVGAVVASVRSGDDDDSAGITDAAVVVTDDESDARVQEDTAATAAAESAGAAEPADALSATAPTAAADTMLEATEGSLAAAAVVSLVGTDELADFVEQLADRPPDLEAHDVGCEDDRFERPLAAIQYAPDDATPSRGAVVLLDAAGTTAAALDEGTCELLAEVAVDQQD